MTEKELQALRKGVARHGRAWSRILDDDELGHVFVRPDGTLRTAVDLKDKWTLITREASVTALLQGLEFHGTSPVPA